MKTLKRLRLSLSITIMLLMIFNLIIPIATNFKYIDNGSIAYADYPTYPRNQSEFENLLSQINRPTSSELGHPANLDTFHIKNLIVYGDPHSRSGESPINGEHRYIGYTEDGSDYPNSDFPPDEGGVGDNPADWIWVVQNGNLDSWNKIENSQMIYNHILNAQLEGNSAEDYNFNLSDAMASKGLSENEMKERVKLISAPTFTSKGTVWIRFHRGDGSLRYATFYVPKLEGTIDIEHTISTPMDNYTITGSRNSIDIPVTVRTSLSFSGGASSSFVEHVGAFLDRVDSSADYSGGNVETSTSYVEYQTTITLNRSDYPEGTHTITLDSFGFYVTYGGGVDLAEATKDITLTVDPEVGAADIYTDLVIIPDPSELYEGESSDIDLVLDASASESATGEKLAFRYWVDTDPSYSNAGAGVNPELDEGDTTPEVWETSLSNVDAGQTIYGKVKVYDFGLNDFAEYETTVTIGEIPTQVIADLQIDAPAKVEWTPKQWDNDETISVRIELDARESYATVGIDRYRFTLNGDNIGSSSSGRTTEYIDIRPSDRNAFGKIPVWAEVEVEDENGKTATAMVSIFISCGISNTPPDVFFTNDDPHYATLPVNLVNATTDKEEDEKYADWTIRTTDGDLIAYSQNDYETGNIDSDFSSLYIESMNLDTYGGEIIFKQSGYYDVELYVMDERGNDDSYSKRIYVNTEPQDPIADFDMYDFGFPNETIEVTDRSTDPNNDIVSRIWTMPSVNLDTGQPASVSGYLSGSGGNLTFAEEGTYEVTLEVRDYTYPLTNASTVTKQVQIIPPLPVARITVSGTLKENRLVTLSSKDSLTPRVDPIQTERNEWSITPMDGQDPSSIKIDSDTSDNEIKNVVFKEPGRYKVWLRVHNNFSDANPNHPQIDATDIEKIITIEEDEIPEPDFNVTGASPDFQNNPVSTTVHLQDFSVSNDGDIIDHWYWTIIRDDNENGDFSDDDIYATFTDKTDFDIGVTFEEGNSGQFQVELRVKEEFGQPTIDKFVTSSDRKENTITKVFAVNWIPDIKFSMTDWAYTDDTLNLSTVIKDEEVDTTKVDWSLKRASESNPAVMASVSLSDYTDSVLDKNGGSIRFKKSGFYELIATVTDEVGQSYSYSETIRVYPLPTAVIKDNASLRWPSGEFNTKENRKFEIDGNSSYAHDYYGPEMHPIDHTKDYWEIIPLDNQGTSVIKIQNGSGGALVNEGGSTKFIRNNDKLEETLLFKEAGRYKIRYQVTNTFGKKSPFAEKIITVHEDTKPNISFDVIPTSYRDADDGKRAELIAYNIQASSSDEDIINIQRIRYRFDSDNDGNFNDESWIGTVPIDYENHRATVKVNHVGKYQFEFMAKEEFGQPTLSEFVTAADRRESYQYKTIEVDNTAPIVDFEVAPSNKVDIVFTIGDVDSSKTQELNSKIDTYVKTALEAENTDYIDVTIQTIETSTMSSNDADAEAIFNNWTRYGANSDTWSFDAVNKIIKRDDNSFWSGFFDPNFNEDNYTLEVELGTDHRDNDDIGVSFGIKDNNPNGHLAFVISQQGLTSVGNSYKTNQHGHPSGLYQYNGSSIKAVARPSSSVSFIQNNWHSLKAKVNGKNIKIWYDGTLVVDYTHTENIKGSFGFFTNSQPCGKFKNLTVTSQSCKTLDEVLKEPTWRENTTRFIVNISDTELPGLNDPEKYPVILSRMLNDNLYFVELGTNINKTQTENFIADNDDKGTFIYNNDMNTALSDLADYILSVVRAKKETNVKYILLNEYMNYTTFYSDNVEEDPKYDIDNWKYNHNQYYFDNSLGRANFHNIWLSDSVNTFDKVGKYTVEYKTKDNPVGSDDRFDEYRKWSSMMNGPLELYVHRKPIAQFSAQIQPKTNLVEKIEDFEDDSLVIDFTGNWIRSSNNKKDGYYSYRSASISHRQNTKTQFTVEVPDGGTGSIEFDYKASSEQGYDFLRVYINGSRVINISGNTPWQHYSRTLTPGTYTIIFEYTKDFSISSYDDAGYIDNLKVVTVYKTGFTVNYTDNSYDLDHTSRVDKGIVDWEWQWKKVGETTWHDGKLTNGDILEDYLVKLRVRDMDGPDNLGVWSDEKIVLITSNPQPPIAQFSITPTTLPIEENLTINDSSYDPNGDNIVEKRWVLTKLSGGNEGSWNYNELDVETVETYVNNRINAQGIGEYKLTLQVRDETGPWGNEKTTSEVYTQYFTVIPVNHAPTANFNPNPNPVKIDQNFSWNVSYSDPDSDNTGFDFEWILERYAVPNVGSISGTPDNIYTYNSATPFSGSFKSNGLPYGAYRATLKVTDKPPVPPYQPTDPISVYVTKEFYVIPEIDITGSYTGNAQNGNTITLKATSNEHVTSAKVNFLGQEKWLNLVSTKGSQKNWEVTFTIPLSNTNLGNQTATFTGYTNYGGTVTSVTDSINIYVRPLLEITPSYTGEAITGETITLRAVTNQYVDQVKVEFLGHIFFLNHDSTSGSNKYWSKDFTIPDTITTSGTYTAKYTAYGIYGGQREVDLGIYVVALKLMDFRLTHIVNHPTLNSQMPKYIGSLPVDYKTGYKATFRIDSKGNPNEVKAKVYIDGSFDKEVTLTKVAVNGNEQTWEGTYYSDADLPDGTIIVMDITAYKGTTYNYNTKEGWNGHVLRINGTAYQDGRIERTN